jgi:hypothetical protein
MNTFTNTKTIKMKQLIKEFSYKGLFTLLLLTLIQAVTWAQDNTGGGSGGSGGTSSGSSSSSSTTSTTTSTDWYTQPWVWVVGGAVLLLLIIALVRGNNSGSAGTSDKVTVTKSVRTDTDV